MKTKHTPGPWTGGFAIISTSTGRPICRIVSTAKWRSKTDAIKYGCTGFSGQTDEKEAVANALLIAAAPDMLKLLQECVTNWDSLEFDAGEWEARVRVLLDAGQISPAVE